MYPLAASRSQNRPPAKSGADAQWGRPRPYGYLHWVWEFFSPYYTARLVSLYVACTPYFQPVALPLDLKAPMRSGSILPVTPLLFGLVARARESAPSLRQ